MTNKSAIVLSGGGSHGAAQVGMLFALLESGVTADAVFGTSVGALNAAVLADGYATSNVERLENMWLQFKKAPPFSLSAVDIGRGILRNQAALSSVDGVSNRLAAMLSYRMIEDAPMKLGLVATRLADGSECLFTSGSVRDVVRASCAVPGLLPPVLIDGVRHVDGLIFGPPLLQAVNSGYKNVVLLLASTPREPSSREDGNWLSIARRAASIVITSRMGQGIEACSKNVNLTVIGTGSISQKVSRRDFSKCREFVAAGYLAATKSLSEAITELGA